MSDSINNSIADLLFEAKILTKIPRSGFHFLGAGKESVAEHVFITTFIAYIMSKIMPDVDALRLITMCLVHDLTEARTGDLNYVQKKYVSAEENRALKDAIRDIPFGDSLVDLINEFHEGKSAEAELAHDADQLALILELKSLVDIGYKAPEKWLPFVLDRLKTKTGKKLSESILKTTEDSWWLKDFDS
ncbi:MAG: HD domain-containing protein [Proteobacteria bacterium]|nr:HD domain-containing protein [Pseudomonadota bacterium]MBU4257884.1 HD domain-containing protein [Pseudomonadota bacterium]MBU4287308.1 HD domain-containing protein [Pseudomonadota bacterium]MBU4414220.1 HD domain-containing protein [Pseudomonadota bacterium]MCG2758206.1 HD domain-containing protein [Desulfobacteraceae bacterium]